MPKPTHQLFDLHDCYKVGHGHFDWVFNDRYSGAFGLVARYKLLSPATHDPTKHKFDSYKLTHYELKL
ncbi:hypothetical protein SLS64_007337 [Diaporthe eres]